MTIRVTNATFESVSPGEYGTVDEAFRAATLAGVQIAAGEIAGGQKSTIVQVAVDLVGQEAVARGAVSLCTERFTNAKASAMIYGTE